MAGQLSLPFGVYVSTDEDLDLKYRVADNAARDALITLELCKLGHRIYHVADNKIYWLKEYPTTGNIIGVLWEELSNTPVIPPIPPDGKSYHILRTNSSTAAPTIIEVPLPKNGDIAIIKLLSTDVIYWTHNGTTWGTDDFTVKSPNSQISFQIDNVQPKTYHLSSRNSNDATFFSLHMFTIGSGSSLTFELVKSSFSSAPVTILTSTISPADESIYIWITGDYNAGDDLRLNIINVVGSPCDLVGTISYKLKV